MDHASASASAASAAVVRLMNFDFTCKWKGGIPLYWQLAKCLEAKWLVKCVWLTRCGTIGSRQLEHFPEMHLGAPCQLCHYMVTPSP